MKKSIANKHSSPMEYKITWRGTDSVGKSEQYFSVFHSSEALDFLAHTMRSGHIHSKLIKVLAVEEWCRFQNIWIDRMDPALEHAESEEIGKTIIIAKEDG